MMVLTLDVLQAQQYMHLVMVLLNFISVTELIVEINI